jgi:N-methylhydantoinase B/oxoprolinase/acetone carboxylase alpha subunit
MNCIIQLRCHACRPTLSQTNTRITDPEILERRYPVVLHAFRLRPGSGGQGLWRGGDGVVREVRPLGGREGVM